MKVEPFTMGGYVHPIERVKDRFGVYLRASSWRQSSLGPRDKDWRDKIRAGDVLRNGKTLRVVRQALYRSNGFLSSVDFVIRHCSWTGRCYTIYLRSDLATIGYRPTGAQVSLRKAIDKQIEKALHENKITLTCCDVEGIA